MSQVWINHCTKAPSSSPSRTQAYSAFFLRAVNRATSYCFIACGDFRGSTIRSVTSGVTLAVFDLAANTISPVQSLVSGANVLFGKFERALIRKK